MTDSDRIHQLEKMMMDAEILLKDLRGATTTNTISLTRVGLALREISEIYKTTTAQVDHLTGVLIKNGLLKMPENNRNRWWYEGN